MFYSLSSFWVHIKRDTYRCLADQGEMLLFIFISQFEAPALNITSEVCAFFPPLLLGNETSRSSSLLGSASLMELVTFLKKNNWNIRKSAVFFKMLNSDAEQNIECLVFSSRRGKYQISQDGINMRVEIKICEFHQICSCGSFMAKLDVYIHLQARNETFIYVAPAAPSLYIPYFI